MKMLKDNRITVLTISLIMASILPGAVYASVDYPHDIYLPNGIEVRIYTPEYILGSMVSYDYEGRMVMDVPGGLQYILVEDIDDPVIVNKGDGQFHPFVEAEVISAVGAIDPGGSPIDMAVEIYILPVPRRFIQTSSTSGLKVFLSPGVYEFSFEVAAHTVTHEIGHCVRN
ncbi:MAG TPA: hypothetical protein VLA34_05960, partial [Candidatus Krumholzibacterium sp.]|nr:hypothetical protein [Candidatus Krumholzibacterium sp.]